MTQRTRGGTQVPAARRPRPQHRIPIACRGRCGPAAACRKYAGRERSDEIKGALCRPTAPSSLRNKRQVRRCRPVPLTPAEARKIGCQHRFGNRDRARCQQRRGRDASGSCATPPTPFALRLTCPLRRCAWGQHMTAPRARRGRCRRRPRDAPPMRRRRSSRPRLSATPICASVAVFEPSISNFSLWIGRNEDNPFSCEPDRLRRA